jgi:hypothetical protein
VEQILKPSLSSILLIDIFNLILEDAPELTVLDPLYLLNSSPLHSQLELDFYIPPLLAPISNI